MQRDPSLNIKYSDLLKVLKESRMMSRVVDREFLFDEDIADKLFEYGYKYNAKNRVLIQTSSKTKKNMQRTVEADNEHIDEFARVYHATLIENNFKAISIRKTDSQYLVLKEISQTALEFVKLFDLPIIEGFKLYIEIAIKILGHRFSIYRMKAKASHIVEYYKNSTALSEDPTPDKTANMFKAWGHAMKEYFNQTIEVTDINKYVNFYYAKVDADKVKANYQDWINGQFAKWAFLNNPPEFSQLHGENATINYKIYMGKKEENSPQETQYFNSVHNEKKIIIKEDQQKEAANQARLRRGMQSEEQ